MTHTILLYLVKDINFFIYFSQNSTRDAEANLNIQWSSKETDKKETCKNVKCKKTTVLSAPFIWEQCYFPSKQYFCFHVIVHELINI